MYLFAQKTAEAQHWLEIFSRDNALLWVFLSLSVVCGIAVAITSLVINYRESLLRHQERMAMIQAGMHPDHPQNSVTQSNASPEMEQTVGYRQVS